MCYNGRVATGGNFTFSQRALQPFMYNCRIEEGIYMYLKNNAIRIYKIKNVIFSIIGCFWILISTWNILSLIVTYWDDVITVIYANSFLGSLIRLPLAVILLGMAGISKRWIGDAVFSMSVPRKIIISAFMIRKRIP